MRGDSFGVGDHDEERNKVECESETNLWIIHKLDCQCRKSGVEPLIIKINSSITVKFLKIESFILFQTKECPRASHSLLYLITNLHSRREWNWFGHSSSHIFQGAM